MPDARIVAGRYRLIAMLSEGGMGSVWSAEHLELKCPAAVKLLSSAFTDSPEALARFKREAQSAASLRSTNIVQILDYGIDNGAPYIAMELLRGRTLAERLAADGRLEPRDAAVILSQVARAATWAHGMGIIHRDLKPSNIFLSQDAANEVVKLLDFGIAKPIYLNEGDAQVTATGTIVGTPQYMSPEQASGRRNVDHRTDIWSFGVIAYECITGRHAFASETLGGLTLAICSDPLPVPSKQGVVPKGFDEWFARCSHRDPGRRFLSIAEAADILCFVCGLEPDTVIMPQLYSEPPPSMRNSLRVARRNIPPGISTDAPSTISLTQPGHSKHRMRVGKAVVGGFVAAAAVLALIARLSPNAGTSHATAPNPQGVDNSLGPKHESDAGVSLHAQPISVPADKAVADSPTASALMVVRELPAQLGSASHAASRPDSSADATKADLLTPIDDDAANAAARDRNPGRVPVAATVENTIGLRRRP